MKYVVEFLCVWFYPKMFETQKEKWLSKKNMQFNKWPFGDG